MDLDVFERDVDMPEGAVLLVQVVVMRDGTAQVARCPASSDDRVVKAALGLGLSVVMAGACPAPGASDGAAPSPSGPAGA